MPQRNKMPGLRLRGDTWHIEKRCKHAKGGWLRESTGQTSRAEAEKYLIKRLAGIEEQVRRGIEAEFLFEEAAMRYLEDMAHKRSAKAIAFHIDQLLPFIGHLTLEHIHDGTLKPYIDHETGRGLSPKSVNNAITVLTAILNRAARVWRHVDGRPWLRQAPPRLTKLSTKGKTAKPYPLSWDEQDRLLKRLPRHLADAALFGVNTGCREREICQLQWDWEVKITDLGLSVFVLPETVTKTETERVVVLNSIASRVIEARRGIHPLYVFTYRGTPMKRLHNNGWKWAWRDVGLPTQEGVLKGVHNLRHTFGRRLRAAGIPLETRKALLGHANGDITTHYSAAELSKLIEAVERITDRGIAQTPTLSLVHRCGQKDLSAKCRQKEKGFASANLQTL